MALDCSAFDWQRINQPLLWLIVRAGVERAGQTPALATLPPLQINLKGAVNPDRIVRQAPVKAPGEPQAAGVADWQALLRLDPHPADVWQPWGVQVEGLGDRALGQLNLQGQGAQQSCPWWLCHAAATGQAQRQHQHQREKQHAASPPQGTPAADVGSAGWPAQACDGWWGRQHGCHWAAFMIGWLQGDVRDSWQLANRFGVLLVVAGVGYEVQLSRRQFAALPGLGATLALHIHHTIREDAWLLYGFAERSERDLFRELVAVSGVGPQVALGLLGELEPRELVRAIIHADLRRLAQAPGVGKRTAERLAVELRSRLQQRFAALADGAAAREPDPHSWAVAVDAVLSAESRDEVDLTLAALGYEPLEIQRALRAVAATSSDQAGDRDADAWIRDCLRWLSQDAA